MTEPRAIDSLETAGDRTGLRRVAIDPVTRVEGHGKVTLLLDEHDRVHQARLHIVEFRGFEKFIQGRPYWELAVLVQRLCGICPVSHHLAAAKAIDQLVGVDELSPTAHKIRRLLHLGQVLQSHALHFFHLASPDLLFGYDDPVAHRNILGVLADHPDIARRGILLRRFGQEVIRVIAGKRVHGIAAVPGGVNKALSRGERDYLRAELAPITAWAEQALALARTLFQRGGAAARAFASVPSATLSLVGAHGELDLYHGRLRVRAADGRPLLDDVEYADYGLHIAEQVRSWSYMKFPYLRALGPDAGSYRVGPLARINNCDFIPTPGAERARVEFMGAAGGQPVQATLAYHWARMIELLYCAEAIDQALQDVDLEGHELVREGQRRPSGIGVIEAPRGTLIHHYEADPDGLVTRANLIVSTTHNNQAMNDAVRRVALDELDGHQLTEGLLNRIEVAIRAYDPCLSCATHALGRMPLSIELQNHRGERLAILQRSGDGRCTSDAIA